MIYQTRQSLTIASHNYFERTYYWTSTLISSSTFSEIKPDRKRSEYIYFSCFGITNKTFRFTYFLSETCYCTLPIKIDSALSNVSMLDDSTSSHNVRLRCYYSCDCLTSRIKRAYMYLFCSLHWTARSHYTFYRACPNIILQTRSRRVK